MRWMITTVWLLLMCVGTATAYQGPYSPNEEVSLPSNCLSSSNKFIQSTQNLTIFYPNGTLFVDNQPMENISVGKFIYNFTAPNVTGTYFVAKTCEYNGTKAQGGDSFEVLDLEEETGMTAVATLLGLLGLTGALFYLSYRHNSMAGIQRLIAPALHLCGIWSVLLPLLYISNAGLIDPMGDTLMLIGLVFVVIYTIIYLPLTVLYLTGKLIYEGATMNKNG